MVILNTNCNILKALSKVIICIFKSGRRRFPEKIQLSHKPSTNFHPNDGMDRRIKPSDWRSIVGKPRNLKHDSLMQMIKPIIPNAITDPPPPPEDANIKVVRGVLNTTQDFYQKLKDSNPKQKSDLMEVAKIGKNLLRTAYRRTGHRSSGPPHIRDSDRDYLLKKFADALKGPEPETTPKAKAPFSRLGEDGFEDVDHQILAMEIKRLAMTVKSYLEVRKNEERDYVKAGANLNDPSIKTKTDTDSILAQTTLMMAKLHRAILRNHHHILMMIGNFAGNSVPAPDEGSKNNSSETNKYEDNTFEDELE